VNAGGVAVKALADAARMASRRARIMLVVDVDALNVLNDPQMLKHADSTHHNEQKDDVSTVPFYFYRAQSTHLRDHTHNPPLQYMYIPTVLVLYVQ
jgi:hypothetical protein